MSITWACRLSVTSYAALGRRAPAPRPECGRCGRTMAFDGRYPRWIREAGVTYRIFVRRARCSACGLGDAVVPDFVLRRRLDSASAVGAAVIAHAGVELPVQSEALYAGVPARTVRSWRQRFAERADELWGRLAAVSVGWGGADGLAAAPMPTPAGCALGAIGAAWRAARRRPEADVPPAWHLANVVVGGRLISTRVDLPWPIDPAWIGRARGP